MFCSVCGAQSPAGASFCRSCGRSIGGAVSVQAASRPTALIIGSLVCALLALLVLPPVLGGLAIFLGYRVYKQDQALGQVLMIIAAIALAVGFVLGFVYSPWR